MESKKSAKTKPRNGLNIIIKNLNATKQDTQPQQSFFQIT